MDIGSREIFPNNKITEAICQFSFNDSLDNNLFDNFSGEILSTKKYVKSEKIPMFHYNINLGDPTSTSKVNFNSIKISNENGDKIVQVFSSNISIHQVGNYNTWDLFLEDIKFIISIFNKIFKNKVTRFDLRAINVFDFNQNEKSNDYFKINVNIPNSELTTTNYNYTVEKVYEPNRCFGVIRGNSIKQDENRKFILDLSFVLLLGEDSLDLADESKNLEILNKGHICLHELFSNVIDEKIKNIIR